MPRALGLVPFYRFLAQWPLQYLGIAYTLTLTVATTTNRLGMVLNLSPLSWVGWALGSVAVSVLFTVVTWYRDDDLVAAAFLIVTITGMGLLASFALTEVVFTKSLAAVIVVGAGAFFTLTIRCALLMPVAAGLIWVARRLRRFFAAATLDDERVNS